MTQPKTLNVAIRVAGIAGDLGLQWQTDDDTLAKLAAETQAHMTATTIPEDAAMFANAIIGAFKHRKPPIKYWTYLCLVANWLSWAWHDENEPELSGAWAGVWYELNDFSLKNLKGDDLKYYIETTD